MQMIAIGGAIGAGFFVSTGSALRAGGPGSLVSLDLNSSQYTNRRVPLPLNMAWCTLATMLMII
jgi:hypothetical protein